MSPEEVLHLIKGLDVRKASGPDGVSAYMLRATAESIAPSLAKLQFITLNWQSIKEVVSCAYFLTFKRTLIQFPT